jgi:NADH-quinone oxidoreductase subunit G
MVVTLSPFKANMDISDVLLPISPFTETAGTFINTEGRAQSFHGVVKPLGEARPAWKVLRVLGSMLHVPGFEFETIEEVRAQAIPADVQALLSNACSASIDVNPAAGQPVSAAIYQLDSLVRRAPSLQLTADAKQPAVDAKGAL